MVALSPVSQRMSALAEPRAAVASASVGGFAQALAALAGRDGGDDTPPLPLPAQRQDAADDGKTLPDSPADPAASPALDPRLLWLPAGLLPTTPAAPAGGLAAPAPRPVAAAIATDPRAALAVADAPAHTTDAAKPLDSLTAGDPALATKLTDLFHAAERVANPHAAAEPLPVPVPAQPQPAPAATPALSTELAALGLDPTARDDRKKIAADPTPQPVTMTTEIALRNAVQPTGETRHVPLDLRDETGLQKMIDHIETLRDGADANDTRIRLVPDALGTVDVAVRREGDAVRVHFTAENADTRTLLTEAQPRLAELAEQRGVRIAGASVDAGTGGSGGHAQPQRQPAAVTTNITTTTTIEATGDDARLA